MCARSSAVVMRSRATAAINSWRSAASLRWANDFMRAPVAGKVMRVDGGRLSTRRRGVLWLYHRGFRGADELAEEPSRGKPPLDGVSADRASRGLSRCLARSSDG